MNAGISSAGCWPSESIVSACVKPAARAAFRPCSTAAPLPPFAGSANSFRPGSVPPSRAAPAGVPSVLPSMTTHTGFHCARAARTVSNTFGPVL